MPEGIEAPEPHKARSLVIKGLRKRRAKKPPAGRKARSLEVGKVTGPRTARSAGGEHRPPVPKKDGKKDDKS